MTLTWTLDPLVVVGVDADFLLFGRERVLADLEWFQFVVALQVGPAPHAAIDDVWQALAVGHLRQSNSQLTRPF